MSATNSSLHEIRWRGCAKRFSCATYDVQGADRLCRFETSSLTNRARRAERNELAEHFRNYDTDFVGHDEPVSTLIAPDPLAMMKSIVPIIDMFFMN